MWGEGAGMQLPHPKPQPREKRDLLLGFACLEPSILPNGWRAALHPLWFWGGEKVLAPSLWAECECLLAAFLTARSVAGVIQRRAEVSAATETTMKRKQSLKISPFINQANCR